MKIVTVDDGDDEARLFKKVFRGSGSGWRHFSEYEDAEAAIANGELDDVDLVLMDMMLEDDSIAGLRLTKALRSRSMPGSIVVLSASQVEDIICRCFRAGASAYVIKPGDDGQLEEVISGLKLAGPYSRRCARASIFGEDHANY